MSEKAISKVIFKSSASATPEVWMDSTTATAAAADILAPKTAMLADGVMTEGTGSGGGPTVTGIAINGGTFTVESSYSGTKTIAHGLGKKPSVMCIYPITSKSNDSGTYAGVGGYVAYGTLNLSNIFPSTISVADPSQSIEVFTGVGFYLPPNQNALSPYTETLYQFGSVYILEPDSTNIYYAIPSGEGVILGGVEYRWWAVCSDG